MQIIPNANYLLFIKSNFVHYTTFKLQCCLLKTNWSEIKIIPAMWALNRCDKCGARMQCDVTPENHASHPLTSHISTVLHSGLFATDFGKVTRQYHTIRWSTFHLLTWVFSCDLSCYCICSSCYISIR